MDPGDCACGVCNPSSLASLSASSKRWLFRDRADESSSWWCQGKIWEQWWSGHGILGSSTIKKYRADWIIGTATGHISCRLLMLLGGSNTSTGNLQQCPRSGNLFMRFSVDSNQCSLAPDSTLLQWCTIFCVPMTVELIHPRKYNRWSKLYSQT